jgi:hypothetical protein
MEENDMKTVVGFTMAALATLVLATAADADAQNRRCDARGPLISVRAGATCVFSPPIIRGGGYSYHSTEIIETPHEGTAVLRTDGRIYYSPRPGFTGRDSMKVQRAACNYSGTWHINPFHDWCGHLIGAYTIFVE